MLTSGSSPIIQAGTLVTPGLMPAAEGNSLAFGGGAMEVRHALTNLLVGEQPGTYFYSLAFKVTALGSMTTNTHKLDLTETTRHSGEAKSHPTGAT